MIDKKFGHRYQKIHSKLWEDEKMVELSSLAQLTYAYLLSNRHNNIMGFYQLAIPPGKMILGMMDMDVLEKHIEEIQTMDMVKYDKQNSLILINNFLKYNPIESPKILAAAHHRLLDIPKSELFYDFLTILENEPIASLGKNSQLAPVVREILKMVVSESTITPEVLPNQDIINPMETKEEQDPIEWVAVRWNEICGTKLSKISKVTKPRQDVIRARIEEYSPEKIEEVFYLVLKSPFLLGENDRGWRADFDFVMSKSKFTKILEGSYRGVSSKKQDVSKSSKDAIQKVAEEWGFPRNQLGEEDGQENISPGPTDDQLTF